MHISFSNTVMLRGFGGALASISTMLICVMRCDTGDSVQKNLALNKPTNQSSTEEFGFGGMRHFGIPSFAVDGNAEIEMENSTCIRAGWDVNPWWTVDLKDIYRVDEVVIVTRNWGFVLDNFTIELAAFTNGTPNGLINPVMCYYEPAYQGQGITQAYPCRNRALARFVKITRWKMNKNSVMAFCEVMVYGSDTEREFPVRPIPEVTSLVHILGAFKVRSVIACAVSCRQYPDCTSFDIGDDMVCELIAEWRGTTNNDTTRGRIYRFLT